MICHSCVLLACWPAGEPCFLPSEKEATALFFLLLEDIVHPFFFFFFSDRHRHSFNQAFPFSGLESAFFFLSFLYCQELE